MSTTVEIIEEDIFRQELRNVRSDDCDTNWFLCEHYEGNPDQLNLVGSGNNGIAEMADQLDDTKYMYGIARFNITIDMSETVKFVYFSWIGKDTSFAKRGRYGVKSGCIKEIFHSYQANFEFDCEEKDTVTEELFRNKLEVQSGTKSAVLDAAEAKDRPERGFTAGVSSCTSNSGAGNIGGGIGKQGTSFGGINKPKAGSSLVVSDDVYEAITAVRSDEETEINCVCVKFEDNNLKKPLCVVDTSSCLTELNDHFKAEDIAIVLVRVNDVVDDIATVKFAYISWIGEKVRPMAKGKFPTCAGDLEDIFKPFHVKVHATIAAEIRESVINDKIGSASGSKSNIK